MYKTKKGVIGLLMAMVMLVTFCIPAMAAETLKPIKIEGMHGGTIEVSENQIDETRAGGTNPTFHSGKVYGYNPTTNYISLAGEATWSWGPVQPGYLTVAKKDYWWMSSNGYEDWYFKYTWNSKDCTYVKIYDTQNEVYFENTVSPNTNYNINFFAPGFTSQIDLRMDRIVDGIRVNNIQIGGMKVIYN